MEGAGSSNGPTKHTSNSFVVIDTQTAVAALDYKEARVSASIPRKLIEDLLNTYFIWYQCAMPVLSRPDFLRCMIEGGEHFRPCLLNVSEREDSTSQIASDVPLQAVLAFASQWTDDPRVRTDPSDPHTAGNAFFQTAKELLDTDFEQPSLSTVQALVVMASREHSCGHDARGWVYNGIACRLALDMGLHLDHTALVQRDILSRRDAFLRSMIFWTVWYFDKEYCALIGRPSSFKDVIITCPRYPDLAKALNCEELLREQDLDWFASQEASKPVPLPVDAAPDGTSVTTSRGVMHLGEFNR